MTHEIFADRVGEIALTGSVVRLDLMSLSATERDEKNQPKLEFRQRIVIPAEGFVQSFALMAQMMQELEKKGLIRRADPAAKPVEAAMPSPAGPASPNFKR